MHETASDLEALQRLLDDSFEASGAHMRRIITPARRIDAAALAARLTGVRLLALATSTRDGRPIVGPVDGIFYRGAFWFGSAPDSVRFRHIRARPDVSATHMEGEPFAVTVHGRAQIMGLGEAEAVGFREALVEVYAPRYGEEWIGWAEQHPYARIDARRMYTFVYEEEGAG